MFLPENIDLAYSEKYNLSIRLSPDGFSFCIHCPGDPSVFHFQKTGLGNKLSHTENTKKVIFDLGFFSQTFHRVTVTVVSPLYTLVPRVFYEKDRAEELFRFNFHDTGGIVLTDNIAEGDCLSLFAIDEELHSFLSRNLWNPSFHHHSSLLIPLFASRTGNEGGKCCFADFDGHLVTIACFSGNSLLSANTFEAADPHDATYFIASVWEKFGFDQSTDRLVLSGDSEARDATGDMLRKLIRRVEQLELNPRVELAEERKKTLSTDLLATLCV